MNRTHILVFTALMVFNTSLLYAQLPNAAEAAAIERLEGKTGSGMIIGVIDGDKVTYYNFNGSGGTAAITPATIVEIGSVTKVFTALLAAQMIEDGKLKLDALLATYLPESVVVPAYESRKISIMDVLTHTSALPRLPDNFAPADIADPYKDYTSDHAYKLLSTYTLTRNPGSQYEYSNYGFALMGLALEHSSGESFGMLVSERICKPLQMNSTWLEVPVPRQNQLAKPFFDISPVKYWSFDAFAAAGALKSTPSDMVRFVQAHLGRFTHPLNNAMDLATAPMLATTSPYTSIGLGWHVTETPGKKVVWHNGETGGFRSFIGYDADAKKGAVVFVNNGAIDPTDIGMCILNPAQPVKRFPKKFEVTHDVLAKYVGTYKILDTFSITISVRGTQIFAQATGQERFEIYPQSATKFNYRVTVASIEFDLEDDVVKGLTLTQNNQDIYGKKVK